jgi:serine/threonine protein kinase
LRVSGPAAPLEEPEAPLPSGTIIDEYVVEDLFSHGAGSSVYRSRQPSLDRTVALKLLPRRRSADARWVEQFRRGARLLAQISHPNIVPVYGVGAYGGREFLAMMYVQGGKALDRAYPAPQSEAALAGLLKAAADVARALAFVHEQGLVHGDVKPSNVLVAPNGHSYLIDFDFALRRGERRRHSRDDDRASGYLPPEIVQQEEYEADPRSDLFALGAALYAVLAGGPPRRGGTPGLEDVRPDLAKPVCALVSRCLDADPRRRFADAGELASELEELVETLVQPGPGRALGPFDIKAEVGRGGMGVVYRAVQQPLGREVALKVLPPEFTALPSRVKRFQREAEAVSKLDHPHIVPLYAFGRAGGYHYFAMKFVRGSTLSAIIERMRGRSREGLPHDDAFALEFPSTIATAPDAATAAPDSQETLVTASPTDAEREAAEAATRPSRLDDGRVRDASDDPVYVRDMTRVFVSAAKALGHAHEQGILHRDIKPANIIIEDGGHPYLLDFGLARDEADLGLTDSAGFVGTPYYMAPEQIRRDETAPVDRRTDVWGLGVTMYETLALRRPFDAKNSEDLFTEIRTAEPTPLRKLNPEVSRELEAVVAKALRRNPAERYQDMAALAADLESASSGGPVEARPVSTLQQLVAQAGRHRVPTGAAVLGAFLIALVAVLLAPQAAKYFQNRREARQEAAAAARGAAAPKGVALVVRIFEDPAAPESPAMHVLPAVWFDVDATAVFPVEAAPEVPKGFDERKHGQLIWIRPDFSTPFSVADPKLYAKGAGVARNLDRLGKALGPVVAAITASPGRGMAELLPNRAPRFLTYRLLTGEGKSSETRPTYPAFRPESNVPVRYVEFFAERGRVERLDEQTGSLSVTRTGVVRPVVAEESAKKLGWVILSLGDPSGGGEQVLGYLRKGGFFAPLRDMRGGG